MRTWIKLTLAAVAVIVAALYFTGRLDYTLYPLGLNFHQCARNGLGATFCGADLTAYERRWQGVEQQFQNAQQTITQEQQAVTQAECQADPSLSFCASP